MSKLKKSHKAMICVLVISLLGIGILQIAKLVDIYNHRLIGDEVQRYEDAKQEYLNLSINLLEIDKENANRSITENVSAYIERLQACIHEMESVKFPKKYHSVYENLISATYDYYVIQKEKSEKAETKEEHIDIIRDYTSVRTSMDVTKERLFDKNYVPFNTFNYDSLSIRTLSKLSYAMIGFVLVYFGYHFLKKLLKNKKI